MVEQQPGLTLAGIARILARSWIVVLLLGVVGAGGAYALSASQPPTYTASASVYFSLRQGSSSTDLNQGSAYTQAQMLSFAQLATSTITLKRVVDQLGLDVTTRDLARNLDVSIPQNTVVLQVTASSATAHRASLIANSVASNLAYVVEELSPANTGTDAAVSARVIQPAVTPTVQSSPNKTRDAALGGILGLLVGAIGAILFALLDTRIRSAEALARTTPLPLLGQIGRFAPSTDLRPVMVREGNSEEAEAFRRVRAGIRFASVDRDVRVILVTSSAPGEGKTTLSVNLALSFAETGAKVLLVDADLRRPRVAKWLQLEGSIGLTTVLVGSVPLEDARRRYGAAPLDLLLSGDVPPNPSELLSSARMSHVLAELSREYDIVIVDTAPVLAVADAALLSPHADLTLLVVNAAKTRRPQLARSIKALELAGTTISGVVLNRVKLNKRHTEYYYEAETEKPPGFFSRFRRSGVAVTPTPTEAAAAAPMTSRAEPEVPTEKVEQPPLQELPIPDAAASGPRTTASTPRKPRTRATSPKPVVPKPVVPTPVVATPVAPKPVAEEPSADEPIVDEPVADEPIADEPVVDEPTVDEPTVVADEAQERVPNDSGEFRPLATGRQPRLPAKKPPVRRPRTPTRTASVEGAQKGKDLGE